MSSKTDMEGGDQELLNKNPNSNELNNEIDIIKEDLRRKHKKRMMITAAGVVAVIVIIVLVVLHTQGEEQARHVHTVYAPQYQQATCELSDPSGKSGVTGTIYMRQSVDAFAHNAKETQFSGVIKGLQVGNHGFHIHEGTQISNSCADVGGHFNPQKKNHGGPNDAYIRPQHDRHAGDLGNINSLNIDAAYFTISDKLAVLKGDNNILGRAIVVHEGEDDMGRGTGDKEAGSKKTGNAGARLACCIITEVKDDAVPIGGRCSMAKGADASKVYKPKCAGEGTDTCCGHAKSVASINAASQEDFSKLPSIRVCHKKLDTLSIIETENGGAIEDYQFTCE